VGWIDAKRFGKEAASAAWLIAHHTHNDSLRLAAIQEMEPVVKATKTDSSRFAHLFDRHRMITGERTRYGTQISLNPQGDIVCGPLENREKVDHLRKEIGLEPLAEYLEEYKKFNKGKDVKIVDDD